MATTTNYGSWTNLGDHYNISVEATVADYLNGGDSDWRERVETSGAFERMVADYRQAINDALPEGVWLTGNEFIGPYYEADQNWDGELDIEAVIEDIDLAPIVERHDPDNA